MEYFPSDATNAKLDQANAQLSDAKRSIGKMAAALQSMRSDLGQLGPMRTDLRKMAHDIGGSFLFRGVK